MSSKVYWALFLLIILSAFSLRIIPPLSNNFFFTMDEANDAVHVREILERHQLQLVGPETGIKGGYAGPLWYYFIAIGYLIFSGHPFGGVLMIVILNITTLALVMFVVSKNVSRKMALLIGLSLLTSWWFYDAARYAFNPFPLVTVAFILIFLLIEFLLGEEKKFILGAVVLGFGFNSEVAGSAALLLFYLSIGFWGIISRKLKLRHLIASILVLIVFFIPQIISEFRDDFSQSRSLINELKNSTGVFSDTNFSAVSSKFFLVISRSTLRHIPELGFFIFSISIILALRTIRLNKRLNKFSSYFIYLTLLLTLISWVFFVTNLGWRDWHTFYLSPLFLVSFLLTLSCLPKKLATIFLIISLVSHIDIFKNRYLEYLKPIDDPSILRNEIGAVDWVYRKAEGKGFYVYNYLPSVLDYPYQYLFWWYGKKNYGYLPCEYLPYPASTHVNYPLFVPGGKFYQQPKRECSNLRFLIIEPDKNYYLRDRWINELSVETKLIDKSFIGKIEVQQRQLLKESHYPLRPL